MVKLKSKAAIFAISAMVAMVPFTALASSYNIWYEFDTTLTGQTRYYDGQNISLSLNSSTPISGITTFNVMLYREVNWGVDVVVGSGTAQRNGVTSLKFPNVGPENYYTYFSKAYDTDTVTGTGIFSNY
ncbi:hypothetical protein CBW65_09915 [Tumebacillus avium]|uniref:Uncharacterized protein n=1 Tax=Tumebacillus avium TaxID=1903704 RepID=A0A1Y0IPJ1_9BACL|nr:hypothetical protein [Tumebacillus avium]ARU61273.1 hypothetical protein CBW65_09915 [Tumebacillus avium]